MRRRKKLFLKKLVLLVILVLMLSFLIFLSLPYSWFAKKPFISPIPITSTLKKQNTPVKESKGLDELLVKSNISFSTISEAEGSSLLVKLNNNGEVFFSSSKSFETQVSSLQLILSRLTIEGKRFTRLDFRFNKPVISFDN